jgi:hypothetical protein
MAAQTVISSLSCETSEKNKTIIMIRSIAVERAMLQTKTKQKVEMTKGS